MHLAEAIYAIISIRIKHAIDNDDKMNVFHGGNEYHFFDFRPRWTPLRTSAQALSKSLLALYTHTFATPLRVLSHVPRVAHSSPASTHFDPLFSVSCCHMIDSTQHKCH